MLQPVMRLNSDQRFHCLLPKGINDVLVIFVGKKEYPKTQEAKGGKP